MSQFRQFLAHRIDMHVSQQHQEALSGSSATSFIRASLVAKTGGAEASSAMESQSATDGGSFPSARPLFGLLGIPEDLLTDYAFRRFVQVFIKGALDLEELWPESLVDERGGCSQNDG